MVGTQYANVVEIRKERSRLDARTVTLSKMWQNNVRCKFL